jgi:Peptidase A4 family
MRCGRPRHSCAGQRLIVAASLLALGAIGLAGCSLSAKNILGPQFGPFAGYLWRGDVRQVSAVVVVPKLDGASGGGVAGSWVGAQGPIAGRSQTGPFFQVGVNEDWNGIGATTSNYYVFWSSAAMKFHPQWLFDVAPGDSVQVSMRVVGERLQIHARDSNDGRQRTLYVKLAGDELDEAAWHQEDVTDARTGAPFAYPQLSPVHFSGLRVDGQRPPASELTAVWMSTQDAFYGPKLRDDAFTVGPIHPSAAALEYERIAVPEDLEAYLFSAQLASWSAATPRPTITAACLRYLRVMRSNISRLRAYHWSPTVQRAINRLVGQFRQLDAHLRTLARRTTAYLLRFELLSGTNIGPVVRAALQMPTFDPNSLSIATYINANWG